MKNKKISVTLIITALTAFVLTGLASSQFNVRGDNADPNLSGSWEVTVMPTGGDPIINYATFHDDGGLINMDPDPNLSAGIGTWERTGPNRVAVTFFHLLSDQGSPLGKLRVSAETILDAQSDTFSGSFRTDVIIGGNVVQSICGTVHARRVKVEQLESCPQP